ncbi:MAG: leucine-rich repeat protein, partial [Bacteroidales bacterium]|nr:leucine-rich repeat protein [Bacteroidales bacterium]
MTAGNFEVSKDQSSEKTATSLGGYEASDFLWGKKAGVVPSEASVGVKLSHKMAAVNLTLNEGTGFGPDEFEGLSKSVILVNTTRKATIDYTTGTVTKLGDPQLDGIVMCPQNDGSFRAIVVPQSVAAGTNLFAITIGGISYGFSQNAAVEYLSGKQLNANITINKKADGTGVELVAGDWQITDWTEDLNTHGGEARQYFVVNVEEPGTLGATIKAMGKNPGKIKNLKVVGNVRDDDFYFMRDSMAILEAVNMKESVIKAPKNQTEIKSAYTTSDEYKYLCKTLGEPDNVSYLYDKGDNIPKNAFKDKTSLCFFSFPENVNVIGESAFSGTRLSGALILPEGMKAIMDYAFTRTNIGSVSFSSGIKYIGVGAFRESLLTGRLMLPNSLLYIGSNAFSEIKGLSGILSLPESMEYLGNAAFMRSGYFEGDLVIPEKITKILVSTFSENTFNGRLLLNNVSILQDECFRLCGFQGELVIPEGVQDIPYSAFYGNMFSSIVFPKSLKTIGRLAFSYNSKLLGKIELPEGFVGIGENAFIKCPNIQEIILPSTLQSLGISSFKDCFGVSKIISNSVEPPTVLSGAFDGVAKDNFTVEVPAQSVKRYQAEPGWSDFKRIAAHYDFSLSRERMRALNGEMTRTYTLRAPANFNWSIESKPDWVTVTPESGTGKTDVTVTISEMARTDEQFEVNEGTFNQPSYKKYKGRNGEIVFKLDDKDYTCSMEVEQYDYDYSDGYVKTHQTATKGNGIDIIFVGEGYDAKDIAKGTFLDNADEAFAAFFDIEPYKTYKEYFNVHSVIAMSDESGIGTVNTIKDTKFGTYFTQNRIKVPASEPIFSWAKKADSGVDFTKALVINLMNTSTYEGICAMYGDGSAIAFCPVSRDAYPYDFRGIIQHEAGGHGFGKLGDEYIYHNAFIQTCDCNDGCDHPKADNDTKSSYGYFKSLGWYKNLSMSGDATQVPWAHLICHSKYSDYVDMFEGGYMHSRGVYRSEATSCMNNNIPYYSAISRQAMVERILDISGEGFTLEKFYANDSDAFGSQTKAVWTVPFDRTFGVDPKWSRGSEEGSVEYMGEHPDYSKIK